MKKNDDLLFTTHYSLFIVFVLTVVLTLVPFSAYGADKLVVKDATGTIDVFRVDDTGKVTAQSVGIATSSPVSNFHVAEENGSNVNRGVTSSQHDDAPYAAIFQYKRSRGTLASQTSLINGDAVGAFHFQAYDGSTYQTVSSIVSKVSGPVSAGSIPGELWFHTGTNGSDNFSAPRMTISTTGTIKVTNLEGNYVNGSAFVCVNNNGELFASETACP